MIGDTWYLIQTLDGLSTDSYFGNALSYSSTGTQFAVGAPDTFGPNTNIGIHEMYDA
jgi:hypothetical protein